MTINVNASGNTFIFDYYFNGGCVEKTVTMDKSTPSDDWYTVTVDQNTINLTVKPNSDSNPRSAYITPKLNGTVSCTNSIIYISQRGNKVCNCEDLVVDLYAIPQSGVSVNGIIGTYSIECEDNLLNGEIKYNGTLTNNVTFSNGYIHIVETIDANDSDSFKEFTFDIKYKNQLCSTYDLSQEGLNVKCDCASIEYYINRTHTKFSLDGTSGNEILIASADTHGCGSLSAKTFTDTIFENDKIRTETSPNGHYYYWYATVKSMAEDSTSTINVYYKDRDDTSFYANCYTAITVECKSSYVFYTCDLITQKQNLLFTNGYYDDSYCIYVNDWFVNKYFYSSLGQTVKFVPHLVDDVTESYLSEAKETYSMVNLNPSGVTLNTITVNESNYGSSYGTYVLYDFSSPLVSISSSNAARKVYFAVDVYVNDILCFTREGMYVANKSEASLTKCDVIKSYLYKRFSGETGEFFDMSYYENWPINDGYDSEKCNVYYKSEQSYLFKATPSAFTYDQNGSDVLGDNNWQQIPFNSYIFGDLNNSYADLLGFATSNNSLYYHCMQCSGLRFDKTLRPKIKLSQPTSGISHYEFEDDGDGYCTNRVRLTSGDTGASYTKDVIYFDNDSIHFGDDQEVFDCSDISLGVWLRARKKTSDNLDYSSCSALSSSLTVENDAIWLSTTTAKDAWQAGGYITTLKFNYTLPNANVQLKNVEDDSDIITLSGLSWNDSSLHAQIETAYDSHSSRIYPRYDYYIYSVSNAVKALNLCGECEEKYYEIILPSASAVTSFTVDTADGSLECPVNMVVTHNYQSSERYGCSKLRDCSDQKMNFTIETPQTYDFNSIVSEGVDVGRFTPITDTQNFRIVANYDGGTPISSFTFDNTTGVIHMVLDSNYHAPSEQTTKTTSVTFREEMKYCNGEWDTCINSNTIEIILINIPTQ